MHRTKNKTTYKRAKTIKPYTVTFSRYEITVPAGSIVANSTACGNDDGYRFWQDWQATAKKLTGCSGSMLAHDLTYRGLNIPAEFCEPYSQ